MPKDNKNNRTYTKEQRDAVVTRMLSENCSIQALSKEIGIPKSTLSKWKANALGKSYTRKNKNPITSRNKFLIVMETYTMSEIELSKYCRKNGLYVQEVKNWRSSCVSSMDREPTAVKELKGELQNEKKRNKELEREIIRKDKALAETAALLVLQKKLEAVWGDAAN